MRVFRYEHRRQAPISLQGFRRRIVWHLFWVLALLAGALGIGVLGYHFVGGLPWIDALLNASMILAGMGPVDALETDGAKVFASAYAIFSGIVFIAGSGFLLTPFAHRLLHRFHWDDDGV